jgi:selenocysteine lyase/cysteine desulfurase
MQGQWRGSPARVGIADVQDNWDPMPGWLDTASYGLPPRAAWEALQMALADWRIGRTSWREWDGCPDRARDVFAQLIGVRPDDVSIGAQVSQMLAPVAAALPDGARVCVPAMEFTSNLFPWLVHTDRGVTVRTVGVGELPGALADGADVVAFSLVQSSDGTIAPYQEIVHAARAVGATVVVDATQACGWLPFDATLADVVVVGGYKWLMGPRGTAFAYLAPSVRDRIRPLMAGWFAGEDVHSSYYGPPLRLAASARRFDLSPAWFSWVGAVPALELIESIGILAIHDHNVGLANRFLTGLGRPPGDRAIVTVEVPDAARRLARAGVRAAERAGRVRASFHVYTTEHDVDLALDALAG